MAHIRVVRDRVVRSAGWRPEWRILLVIALAWVVLAAGAAGSSSESGSNAHGAHAGHHGAGGAEATPIDVLAALPAVVLMSLAMMTPAALPAVRHVGLNSIRRRRQWAMTLYTAAYVAVWGGFGVLSLLTVHVVSATTEVDDGALLALSLAAAAGWQFTRWKRRAIYACRRTVPLPPQGLRADAGCVRFALDQAGRGVRSCWALMVVMVVAGHSSVVWMAAVAAFIVIEEQTYLGRRLLTPSAAVLALAAAGVAGSAAT